MDGAWRMHHGQIPHQDFYSVLGPLPLACLRTAFACFGPSPDAIPLAMAVFGVPFSAIFILVAHRRLPPLWCLLGAVAVWACMSAAVPLGLGGGPFFGFRHQTTYAMFYNRLGWGAILPGMCAVLLPARVDHRPLLSLSESFWLGVCLVSCMSVKLNFAVAGVGLAVCAICFNRSNQGFWVGISCGLATALLLYWVILGNVFGYITDSITLIRANQGEPFLQQLLIRLQANRFALFAFGIAFTWIWSYRRVKALTQAERGRLDYLTAAGLAGMGLSLFIASLNWERAELPGLLVVGLILVELARRNWPSSAPETLGVRLMLAKAVAAFVILSYLVFDLGSLAYSAVWKRTSSDWSLRCEQIQGEFFERLPVPIRWNEQFQIEWVNESIESRPRLEFPASMMTSLQFTRWINDGAALLTNQVGREDRIFVADWLNPYNLIFDLPPAVGGALLWDYLRMMNEKHHPDVSQAVQEITLIMVPKIPHLPAQSRFMVKTYVAEWVNQEHLVGESRFWYLYRKPAGDSKR
jgi:hypothetical protein